MKTLNYKIGDFVILKKPHVCKNDKFKIIRVGMEIKLRCVNDDAIIVIKRNNFNKILKEVISE